VVVASGVLGEEQAEPLRQMVRESLKVSDEGRLHVSVSPDALNLWGVSPRPEEYLAWAAAALEEDGTEMVGPIVSELMSGYDVRRGFGAGSANSVVIEVLAEVLPGLSGPTSVRLMTADRVLTSSDIGRGSQAEPVLLSTSDLSSGERVRLAVEPAATGLAWTAVHRRWVPWTTVSEDEISLTVTTPRATVGVASALAVSCTAVVGGAWTLEIGLPPGATVDLDGWNKHPRIDDAYVLGEVVVVETRALSTGERVSFSLPVTPGFRGTMMSPPHRVSRAGETGWALPPTTWRVR
jgi:hypothetical protein